MSKSMWIPTEGDNFPIKREHDDRQSERVLVWIEGETRWDEGHYNYYFKDWEIDRWGRIPTNRVKYFAYIDNPYK